MSVPALVILLPLEQAGQVKLDAGSFEDEQRLRLWLRRSRTLEALPAVLDRLLNDLEEAA